jgi:hypothetical protein
MVTSAGFFPTARGISKFPKTFPVPASVAITSVTRARRRPDLTIWQQLQNLR